MKSFRIILSLLAIVIALFSGGCDKVNNPYPESVGIAIDSGIVWDDSATSVQNGGKRFVFLEEYTGHKCPNCPESSEIAQNLREDNKPALVTISIHTGSFAVPENSGSKYTTDFRTTVGDELDGLFKPISYPRATIDRVKDAKGEWVIRSTVWETEVDKNINTSAIADIFITNRYDDSTMIIQNEVAIDWLQSTTDPLNLQLFLIEDSIIDWQTDDRLPSGQQDIEDYVHRHILRLSINGLYGQNIGAGTANTSDTVITNFQLPLNVLELKHCSIVAFLYYSKTDYFEVMQVNEAYILSH